MKTDYESHDIAYQQLKVKGAFGWTSEADHQVVRSRISEILEQRSLPPGSRVLDLGCGTGDLAVWLAQKGYEAYGIDIAPTAIAWAKEKANTQQVEVQFTVGSVLNLAPYPDRFFHLVVDGRCLHCLIGPDRAATLSSIYRTLHPGGCFYVQSMCGDVLDASSVKPQFDPTSCCTINSAGVATRYIGKPEDILQELQIAGFELDQWEILPRVSEDDQDDLLVQAIKQ